MIKNINLVKEINETNPKGMNNVNIETLSQVTNNFVEHIDCLCLDELPVEVRNQVFPMILSKLCIGGTLSLKTINLRLLANKIKKSELTGDKLSAMLPQINSVWSDNETSDLINKYGLVIKGMYYDQIYTIFQLEKTA